MKLAKDFFKPVIALSIWTALPPRDRLITSVLGIWWIFPVPAAPVAIRFTNSSISAVTASRTQQTWISAYFDYIRLYLNIPPEKCEFLNWKKPVLSEFDDFAFFGICIDWCNSLWGDFLADFQIIHVPFIISDDYQESLACCSCWKTCCLKVFICKWLIQYVSNLV